MGKKAELDMEKTFHWFTYSALIVFSLSIFTSVSFSAVGHILLFPSGVYFFSKWLKEKSFKVKTSVWALLAMLIICIASVLFNLDIIDKPFKNIFKTKYFLIAFLSFFSFQYMKKEFLDDNKIKLILRLFLLATSVATVSGLIGLWTGYNPLKMKPPCHPDRACGLYGMYMTYGYGMGFYTILVTGALIYYQELKKWIPLWALVIAFLLAHLGLYFSFARGAWIGYAIALPFFFFKKNKKRFLQIIAVLGILSISIFIGSEKVRNTFLNRKHSNLQRVSIFQAAYYATKERPLLGYGYRNFEPHSKKIKKRYSLSYDYSGSHAHNNLLEHMASTGIIGLLSLLVFIFLWIRETYKDYPLIFPFVVSFFVSGMTQYTFGDGENLFLLMTIFSFF